MDAFVSTSSRIEEASVACLPYYLPMDRFIVPTTVTPKLVTAFLGAKVVTLDIEGVDLGRNGIISAVQLATADERFILDVLAGTKSSPLVASSFDW